VRPVQRLVALDTQQCSTKITAASICYQETTEKVWKHLAHPNLLYQKEQVAQLKTEMISIVRGMKTMIAQSISITMT